MTRQSSVLGGIPVPPVFADPALNAMVRIVARSEEAEFQKRRASAMKGWRTRRSKKKRAKDAKP
jgi:hypothetical protein